MKVAEEGSCEWKGLKSDEMDIAKRDFCGRSVELADGHV